MGRGKHLTSEEKMTIVSLHERNIPERSIAAQVRRSKTAVHTVIAKFKSKNSGERRGAKSKVSQTKMRALLRHASCQYLTANDLKRKLELPVTVRRVQQLLNESGRFVFQRMKKKPKMTKRHKKLRLDWARFYVYWSPQEWKKVVFSDETRFNLDGPDGFARYWHDLRKEPRSFLTRHSGGGGVMLWGAIAYNATGPIIHVKGSQDSTIYINRLENHLIPFAEKRVGKEWIFQQDGARSHTSKLTKKWFVDHNVSVLPWPAVSPDLNIIENIWGWLARDIYKNGRQFETVKDLMQAIKVSYQKIDLNFINSLYDSLPKRCVEVIEKQGMTTHY